MAIERRAGDRVADSKTGHLFAMAAEIGPPPKWSPRGDRAAGRRPRHFLYAR